jgi:hypothetical protein
MSRDGQDIAASFARYFNTVHGWFPVIFQDELYHQLARLRSSPNADLSILLLAIHLMSQMYSQSAIQKAGLDRLYHTTKSFHSVLISTGRSSMESIQAGLLLGLYEHCQAIHDATYQTLGACARMGYALGFHKTLSQEVLLDAETNVVAERQRHVWWAIIILERYGIVHSLFRQLSANSNRNHCLSLNLLLI